jgi:hypothetical protein
MDVTVVDKAVYVVLSERNIEQLQKALQLGVGSSLVRRADSGYTLFVRLESNQDHYKTREAGPGFEPWVNGGTDGKD